MTPVLAAALEYIARGWHVFPLHGICEGKCTCWDPGCERPGKHPAVVNGMDEATTDRRRVHAWFDTWHWANVGIACGPSGLAVLDVDPRNGGIASLERRKVDLRKSGKVRTGDGFHLYFSGPAPTSVADLGPGLDVRGVGGYVVAPPSVHVSGNAYTWLRLGVDPLPQWPFPVTALPAQLPVAEPLEPGSRNATLFSIAGMLQQARQAIERLDAQLPRLSRPERERTLVKARALLNEMRAYLPR